MVNIVKEIKDIFKLENISKETGIPLATLTAYSRGTRNPKGVHLSCLSKYFVASAHRIVMILVDNGVIQKE